MDSQTNIPVCISGNPSDSELVAISAAYTSLLRQIGDNSGDRTVEIGDSWPFSSRNRVDVRARNAHLAGNMKSWQQNMRIASRM